MTNESLRWIAKKIYDARCSYDVALEYQDVLNILTYNSMIYSNYIEIVNRTKDALRSMYNIYRADCTFKRSIKVIPMSWLNYNPITCIDYENVDETKSGTYLGNKCIHGHYLKRIPDKMIRYKSNRFCIACAYNKRKLKNKKINYNHIDRLSSIIGNFP